MNEELLVTVCLEPSWRNPGAVEKPDPTGNLYTDVLELSQNDLLQYRYLLLPGLTSKLHSKIVGLGKIQVYYVPQASVWPLNQTCILGQLETPPGRAIDEAKTV